MTTPAPQDQNPYMQGADPAQPQYPAAAGQPQYDAAYAQPASGYAQPKSHMTALLLSIFLGGLGIVDFYMGYKKYGIIKLVLSVLAGVLYLAGSAMIAVSIVESPYASPSGGGFVLFLLGGFLLFVVSIWALVTIICVAARKWIYATDSAGVPLA
ncbi:TM2 domain-containing protein [Actinomyces sp. B33]|uniref:TM2 domain-containing protein n=1 Tax=Actinomyces sp. B33 TaxID=2942131 RepID=UPI002341C120|nr:TM2 domain-containing protein [Actinomyces sp. B33]MDC4233459.1 TM2 domain-containing protein [Actinomyces sp. B33]